MGKKRLRAAKRAAKHLPRWLQDIAFTKAYPARKKRRPNDPAALFLARASRRARSVPSGEAA